MPRVSNRTKSSRNASSIEILPLLREFVDNCVPAFENLPAEWKEIDIRSFSNEKVSGNSKLKQSNMLYVPCIITMASKRETNMLSGKN